MKHLELFRILAAALTLSLLVSMLVAVPAMAQTLLVQPTKGKVGDRIEAYGYGFTSNMTYKFYLSNQRVNTGYRIDTEVTNYESLGTKTADTDNTIVGMYFDIPARLLDGAASVRVSAGTLYVYVTQSTDNIILARVELTVQATGEIRLSPEEGPVGTTVDVIGSYFYPQENISIKYDNNAIAIKSGDTGTDIDGAFAAKIAIPASVAGSHTITVTGADSNSLANATFIVDPQITANPKSGAPGNTVTVNGTGYGSSIAYNFYFNNAKGAGGTTTTTGNLDFTFVVPVMSPGTYTILVDDAQSHETDVNFTIPAALMSVGASSGYSGSSVKISGSGFIVNKSLTVTFDSAAVTTTPSPVTTDSSGNFSASFTVPDHASGVFPVRVTDGTNSAKADFTVLTSTAINPVTSITAQGYVGQPVTINGAGFTPGQTATVTYDGTQVKAATILSNGTVSITFDAPASKGGEHTVAITDGATTRQLTFYMDSVPPASPVPLVPEMGIKAAAETIFNWEDVGDPSGVTYTLQIATNKDFSAGSMVLEKKGLTQSEYTLTQTEKLEAAGPGSPYFWHVKAIDRASNEGQWSGTGTFYVGGIATSAVTYVLIGIGAVIIILLIILLAVRLRYR